MLIAKSEIESSGIRFPKFFVFSVYFVVKALPIQRMAGAHHRRRFSTSSFPEKQWLMV
jgi:hypothetical protein